MIDINSGISKEIYLFIDVVNLSGYEVKLYGFILIRIDHDCTQPFRIVSNSINSVNPAD